MHTFLGPLVESQLESFLGLIISFLEQLQYNLLPSLIVNSSQVRVSTPLPLLSCRISGLEPEGLWQKLNVGSCEYSLIESKSRHMTTRVPYVIGYTKCTQNPKIIPYHIWYLSHEWFSCPVVSGTLWYKNKIGVFWINVHNPAYLHSRRKPFFRTVTLTYLVLIGKLKEYRKI